MALIRMMKQFIGFLMMLGALFSFAQSRLHADPAVLLEKAVYLQDVVADLDQALEVYQQAANECASSGDLHARIHLNWANCLFLKGECADSDRIIGNLLQQYKNTRWEQAAYDLVAAHYQLDFRTPNWSENLVDIFTLTTATGQEMGKYLQYAQRIEVDGRSAWQLTTITNPFPYPSPHLSKTILDAETLEPISQRSSSPLYGDMHSTYNKDKVITYLAGQEESDAKETSFIGPIYDNDQIIYMLGLLPFQEGYDRITQIYIPYNLLALNVRFTYAGLTELSLSEGTVTSKKVNLELRLGPQGVQQQLFYSNDEDQKLLGFFANNMACLKQASVPYPREQQNSPLDLQPLSFTAPADWLIYAERPGNQHQIAGYTMISLQDGSHCSISSWKGDPDSPFSAKRAREYAQAKADKIEGFTWDNPDGEERTIDGHSFILFTGSFEAMGSQYREWRIHGWDDAHNYVLEMRCKMDNIDTIEAVWNALIQSIQFLDDHESHD